MPRQRLKPCAQGADTIVSFQPSVCSALRPAGPKEAAKSSSAAASSGLPPAPQQQPSAPLAGAATVPSSCQLAWNEAECPLPPAALDVSKEPDTLSPPRGQRERDSQTGRKLLLLWLAPVSSSSCTPAGRGPQMLLSSTSPTGYKSAVRSTTLCSLGSSLHPTGRLRARWCSPLSASSAGLLVHKLPRAYRPRPSWQAGVDRAAGSDRHPTLKAGRTGKQPEVDQPPDWEREVVG